MTTLAPRDIEQFHSFALDVVSATNQMILELWRGGRFAETLKDDQSPVTEVDLRAEELAREMITKKFPTHGILGEEYPHTNPDSEFQWTVDPIDGTQNLVNRIPTFGTLLGLRFRDAAILGVIDHPVLGLRTSGATGLGVKHNGAPIALPDIAGTELSPMDIIGTNSRAVFGLTEEGERMFSRVMAYHPHARIYYDCYVQTLALLGSLSVVVEPNLKIWDVTPFEALVPEAGGLCVRFGDSEQSLSPKLLTNAIFGKQKAVRSMCSHIGVL